MAAGPLVLVGFFLPWANGPGLLAASEFTGLRLIAFAGRLELLDLTMLENGSLWLVRLLLFAMVVAAVWNTLLAPAHRWHFAYAISGWYLVAIMALALGIGVARSGVVMPHLGLGLCGAGALLFGLCELADFVRRRGAVTRATLSPRPATCLPLRSPR